MRSFDPLCSGRPRDGSRREPRVERDASTTSTAAPGGSVDPASITGTIRLLSYSDGFDPGYLAAFEQQYPNITIETSSMGSNEEAIAKIQAGFDADVVNSCVDEATLEMVQKGIYAPLDMQRLDELERAVPVDADSSPACRSTARSTCCRSTRARPASCTTPTSSRRRPTRGPTCSIRSGPGAPAWRTSRSPRS